MLSDIVGTLFAPAVCVSCSKVTVSGLRNVTRIRYIILRCTQLGIKEFVRMINQDYGSFLEPSQRGVVVIQSSLLVTVTPFAGT